MKLIKPPSLVKKFFSNIIWQMPAKDKDVYLTFDDCSDEDVTLWAKELLDSYNVKATFFCNGENIEYNRLDKELIVSGHSLANHGYRHLDGFKTKTNEYVQNVYRNYSMIESDYFRPPYGHFTLSQYKILSSDFKFVMWSILTYDFDETILPVECFENVKQNIFPGAIIVFHTSRKAYRNLRYALPVTIDFLLNKRYTFKIFEK